MDEIITDEVQRRLDHGIESEIHVITTLTSKFLPFFFPGLKYVEKERTQSLSTMKSSCFFLQMAICVNWRLILLSSQFHY